MENSFQKVISDFEEIKKSCSEVLKKYDNCHTQSDFNAWYDIESDILIDLNNFIKHYYPEVYDYIDDSDGEYLEDRLMESSTPREFIEELIHGFFIDPIDLVELNRDTLLKEYLDSKEL